jgi:class 3 adenylate cyclase/CheY-like chemotaxis protein
MSGTRRILVVDDIEQNVRLLADVLESQGYEVVRTYSGHDALQCLRTERIDLMLLDVVMPDLSGLEVCRTVREKEGSLYLPILLVTALDSTEDRIKGIEAGADDFITKPVDIQELLTRVRSLLRIRDLIERVSEQADELVSLNTSLEERVQKQVEEIESLDRFRRFLSPQVADAVLSSSDDLLKSHRREVAVLFCDLRGFTAFSDSVEPEETMRLLHEFHDQMGDIIDQMRGTIGYRAGDGIMVVFNDPLPCEAPAKDAVELARAMRERMIQLRQSWQQRDCDLGLGIGVAIGFATLGLIGNKNRLDYTANGTVVNLAARLCDAAGDGEILITRKVALALDDATRVEDKGTVDLKGFRDPIPICGLI